MSTASPLPITNKADVRNDKPLIRTMNHTHFVEWELSHLERLVLRMSAAAQFPPAYWEARVAGLSRQAVVADHLARIERLKKALPPHEFPAMVA
ncbi:hypothetical protein PPMP20_29830 [Paraburkholderia phymatum]|nr:hypothetical protein [Paraburkholderia phymatum]